MDLLQKVQNDVKLFVVLLVFQTVKDIENSPSGHESKIERNLCWSLFLSFVFCYLLAGL